MNILVTVKVPDGDKCEGCDLWYRAENKDCYCLLFGMQKLNQRYREPRGLDVIKCTQCIASRIPDGGANSDI
jgi:hypothetical protein